MTYETFIEQIKARAHEELGYDPDRVKLYQKGFTSSDTVIMDWIKDCNRQYTGKESTTLQTDILTMDAPRGNKVVNQLRIATRQMYDECMENGFEAVFNNIREMSKEYSGVNIDEDRLRVRARGDYEKIRDQLILRPLNYNLHIRDLQDCVYRIVSDFVLCLYQVLADTDNKLITSKIKKSDLEKWGVDEQIALDNALKNTARLYPPCVYDLRTQKEENFLEKDFTREDISFPAIHRKLITLSTFNTTNGAVALFYPGVMEKMMKVMGGRFQAVFMNVNDVLIFDENDGEASYFAKTARESGIMGEMLSGRAYLCDGKNLIPGIIAEVYPDGKVVVDAGSSLVKNG